MPENIKAKDLYGIVTTELINKTYSFIKLNSIKLNKITKFKVKINNEWFPPKDFLRKLAELEEYVILEPTFNGGEANKPFVRLDYEIVNSKEKITKATIKMDKIQKLLNEYKSHIKQTKLINEVYKWELVQNLKGKPSINSSDFKKEIEDLKLLNLTYQMAVPVLKHLVNTDTERLRDLFAELFDKNSSLNDRILEFKTQTLKFYRTVEPKLGSHQDERTMATYLTLHNPEKYTFYTSTLYKSYCELIQVKAEKPNKKYAHYLKLINDLIHDYIEKDSELIDLVRQTIPSYYDGINHLLLAQDILFFYLKSKITTFDELILSLEAYNSENSTDEYDFYFGEKQKNYVWVSDKYSIKATQAIHYEILQNSSKKIELVIHFETEDNWLNNGYKKNWIGSLPDNFEWFPWSGWKKNKGQVSQSIKYKTSFNWNTDNLVEEIYEGLIELAKVGLQVQNLNTNTEMNIPLNQILFGPPGTGKTYHTINEAIKIANPNFDLNQERGVVKAEYDRLLEVGQIVFTTFHQSMSYEDFVEGIKPSINQNDDVVYDVEDGVFKELAITSKRISVQKNTKADIDFSNVSYFKMSLGGKNRKDIHNWYLENDYIALGWGGNNDYNILKDKTDWIDFRDAYKAQFSEMVDESKFNIQAVFAFQHLLKKGDVVLVSLGNHIIDAVGIVTGDYEYIEDTKFPFRHNRKVKWLATGLAMEPKLLVDKKISQQSIYQFYDDDIKVEVFKEMFNSNVSVTDEQKNFVLIIDEINRGNVSAIFGELITLIEEDKRAGAKEALSVTLPYSKQEFSVPSNLHIIGTMNTADRSVEALDTALRRRFTFKEMLPDIEVIKDEKVGVLSMATVLKTINERIEMLIDRDHTIGHSYFIGVNNEEKLLSAFKDKIIPLLQEYFYGDYGKIGLVLGNGFVKKENNSTKKFAAFTGYEDSEGLKQDSFILKKLYNENIVDAVVGISLSVS